MFSKAFAKEPARAIEWAFEAYFAEPKPDGVFFPKPGEIKAYTERYHEMQRQNDADKRQAEYLAELRRARESGEAAGTADVMAIWAERIKTMPEPNPNRREELRKQLQKAITKRHA